MGLGEASSKRVLTTAKVKGAQKKAAGEKKQADKPVEKAKADTPKPVLKKPQILPVSAPAGDAKKIADTGTTK